MKSSYFTLLMYLLFSGLTFSQCNETFNLGNDTMINCGTSHVLSAPAGMSYAWSNGSSQSSITVTQPGTYFCYANRLGANLVYNGDFSVGDVGFQSSYIYGTGGSYGLLSNEGQYAIASSPRLAHTNFVVCNDHTLGTPAGSMMVVNGASTPNVTIWSQNITVQPNTDYQFSTWAMTAFSQNPGQLRFMINGIQIGNIFTLPSNTCQWQQFYATWNSGANTNIQIAITNQNTNVSGNDFAIDDIEFTPVCNYYDEIVITMPPKPIIITGPDVTVCAGENVQLSASSATPNLTYTWNPGSITGATINITPTISGTYTVRGAGTNGCTSDPKTVSVSVNLKPVLSIAGNDTICFGDNTTLTVTSSIANTTFNWPANASTSGSINVGPMQTTTYMTIGASPAGCMDTAVFKVTVKEDLKIQILGNTTLCNGQTSLLTASSNLPNTSYLWFPSNTTDNTITISDQNIGWIYLNASQGNCGVKKDSVLVKMGQAPVINVPSDFNICLGESINASVSADLPNSNFVWIPGNLTGTSNVLTPLATITYYVYAEKSGCVSEIDSFTINVSQICNFNVPNVFTPNGDASNDYFKLIDYNGIQSLKCVILNRWGNAIRTFDTPSFEWDGTDNTGKEVTEGTYFYLINAVTFSNEAFEKSGNVQLVRK